MMQMCKDQIARLKVASRYAHTLSEFCGSGYGNEVSKLLDEAAESIEILSEEFDKAFSTICKAYRENPNDKILADYMMKNTCCVGVNDDRF